MPVPPKGFGAVPRPPGEARRLTASGLPVVEAEVTPSGLLGRFRAADFLEPAPADGNTHQRRRVSSALLHLVRSAPAR